MSFDFLLITRSHLKCRSWYDATRAPNTMTAMLDITRHDADWWKNHQSPVTITMFVKFLNTVTFQKKRKVKATGKFRRTKTLAYY